MNKPLIKTSPYFKLGVTIVIGILAAFNLTWSNANLFVLGGLFMIGMISTYEDFRDRHHSSRETTRQE